MRTETENIIRLCKEAGLKEPEFVQEEEFKIILWRKYVQNNGTTDQATDQATDQVSEMIKRVIVVLEGELKNVEIMDILELKHRVSFRENYLIPSIEEGFIEMTVPDKPNHPDQKYRLTAKGLELKNKLQTPTKKK